MEYHLKNKFPIVLCVVFSFIILYPLKISADEDEDAFVRLYGNDVNVSGVWLEARKISLNEGKLKDVAYEAHKLITPKRFEIEKAKFVNKILTFSDKKYQPINADMIEYVVAMEPDTPPQLLAKGLRQDCVFHLWLVSWDEREEYELNGQVCSIYYLSRL